MIICLLPPSLESIPELVQLGPGRQIFNLDVYEIAAKRELELSKLNLESRQGAG